MIHYQQSRGSIFTILDLIFTSKANFSFFLASMKALFSCYIDLKFLSCFLFFYYYFDYFFRGTYWLVANFSVMRFLNSETVFEVWAVGKRTLIFAISMLAVPNSDVAFRNCQYDETGPLKTSLSSRPSVFCVRTSFKSLTNAAVTYLVETVS